MSDFAPLRSVASWPRRTWVLLGIGILICGFAFWQNFWVSPAQRHIDNGVQLLQKGRNTAAEDEWTKAVQADPSNAQAWELLGNFYLSARDYQAALKSLEHVHRLNPAAPDLQARLAVAAYQLKQPAVAERYAHAELKRNPNNIAALQTLAALAADKPAPLNQLKYLQQLADLQPQNAEALTALAQIRQDRNEYDQVLPLANRLVKLNPNSGDALFRRGVALYTTNDNADSLMRAKADFQQTLRLDPANIEAHRYLARIYMRLNQPRQAIAEFQRLSEGRPYAMAHFLELSNAYRRAGDDKKADELRARFARLKGLNTLWIDLKKQLSSNPDDADKNLRLGIALTEAVSGEDAAYQLYRYQVATGNLQSAQFYLNQAAKLRPNDAQTKAAHARLDAVYNGYLKTIAQALKNGDTQTAREILPHAVLLRPDDPRTLALGRRLTGR